MYTRSKMYRHYSTRLKSIMSMFGTQLWLNIHLWLTFSCYFIAFKIVLVFLMTYQKWTLCFSQLWRVKSIAYYNSCKVDEISGKLIHMQQKTSAQNPHGNGPLICSMLKSKSAINVQLFQWQNLKTFRWFLTYFALKPAGVVA